MSEMASAPRHHIDRRAEILDAAQGLLAEGGFHAATVRAVAARAGIGASTMRYWFPSQAALTAALAQRALSLELNDMRIAEAAVPAPDRLFECLAQFLPADEERLGELEGWLALVTSAVGPEATPVGTAMYEGLIATTRGRVTAWLDLLAAEGAIASADVPRAVTTLLCRIDGFAVGLLRPGQIDTLATARAILRDDVTHVLRAESR